MPEISIQFSKEITENFVHDFEIVEDGLYMIEIIASAKSWWQNLKEWKSFFNDDDLAIKIDGIEFPKLTPLDSKHLTGLNGKRGLFDGEVAWNGNNLKGLKKTNVFIIKLSSGKCKIEFIADQHPYLESIRISKTKTENCAEYIPSNGNKQAQDGNNRQWINIAIVDLQIKSFEISAKTEKREKDSDDIKLIIDGEIQKKPDSKKFKNWYWCGSLDDTANATDTKKEEWKGFKKELNLQNGLHYIELWADRMPTLAKVEIVLNQIEEQEETQEESKEPQKRIPTVDDPKWTGNFNDDTEQMILARAIFGEARNEFLSDKARIAVGWSIRNRVELQTWWGKNYHEVILKPTHYSCFTATDPNYRLVIDPLSAKSVIDKKAWPKCYEIAGKILKNEVSDPVNGATCYHDISLSQEKFITEIVPGAKFIKKIDRLMFYYSPN